MDRQPGDAALLGQRGQGEQHDLGPVDGEGGDDDHASSLRATGDDAGELVEGLLLVLVGAVAVGRLGDQHVDSWWVVGRDQEGVGGTAEVAGEQQPAVEFLQAHLHRARPEDVTGRAQHDLHARCHRHPAPHRCRPDQPQCGLGVFGGVQRHGGVMTRVALPVGVVGLLLLEVGGIAQDDVGQCCGRRRAPDGAMEPLADQRGQVSDVVQMRVGDDDGVDGRGIDGERLAIALPELTPTLEHAAVDENPCSGGVDQVTAAGDGAGGTEEPQGARATGRGHGRSSSKSISS